MHYTYETVNTMATWTAVAFILAVIGGVLGYFLFVKGTNLNLSDNLKKVRDFLDFDISLLEPIVKILYLIVTIFVILVSFNFIATDFLTFIITLILGPTIVRIIYEAIIIMINIWKNTTIIAKSVKNLNVEKKAKAEPIKEKTKKEEKENA